MFKNIQILNFINIIKFQIHELYRIGPRSREVQIEYIGNWNLGSPIRFTNVMEKYRRRSNLKGYHLHGVGLKVSTCYCFITL